jgi:hypothetical protein
VSDTTDGGQIMGGWAVSLWIFVAFLLGCNIGRGFSLMTEVILLAVATSAAVTLSVGWAAYRAAKR